MSFILGAVAMLLRAIPASGSRPTMSGSRPTNTTKWRARRAITEVAVDALSDARHGRCSCLRGGMRAGVSSESTPVAPQIMWAGLGRKGAEGLEMGVRNVPVEVTLRGGG